jgi:hypothetical protein
MNALYHEEFDRRTKLRGWWRNNIHVLDMPVTVDQGELFVSHESLCYFRDSIIADHSFDEACALRTKDQMIAELEAQLEEAQKEAQNVCASYLEKEQELFKANAEIERLRGAIDKVLPVLMMDMESDASFGEAVSMNVSVSHKILSDARWKRPRSEPQTPTQRGSDG